MKTMTCKQLAGACDLEFKGETFEEISELSKAHGKEMYEKGDKAHLVAMGKMQAMMQKPGAVQEWFASKKREFNSLKED